MPPETRTLGPPRPAEVVAAREAAPGVVELALAPLDGAPPAFLPGQFAMLYAFGAGEVAISIAGRTRGPRPALLHAIRGVGAATRRLTAARAGDRVGFRGPFGVGWPLAAQRGRSLLFLAGGLGLAPLRPAIVAALAERSRYDALVLLAGARTPGALPYREALEGWSAGGLRVVAAVDAAGRGWTGRVGPAPRFLPEALEGIAPDRVSAFLCGPEPMMRAAARGLRDLGVAAARIHLSLERNMKCALGLCGRCQFGPDFLCRDGPVLPYARIASRLDAREL